MRLGTILGTEGQKLLDRAASRQQQHSAKAKRQARLAEINRARQRGGMIVYKMSDE